MNLLVTELFAFKGRLQMLNLMYRNEPFSIFQSGGEEDGVDLNCCCHSVVYNKH